MRSKLYFGGKILLEYNCKRSKRSKLNYGVLNVVFQYVFEVATSDGVYDFDVTMRKVPKYFLNSTTLQK